MKRMNKISADVPQKKVSQVYEILKGRFERRRQKLRELEEMNFRAVDDSCACQRQNQGGIEK